ncbi:hypothetical protein STZ1_11029 [Bacillus subtilis]
MVTAPFFYTPKGLYILLKVPILAAVVIGFLQKKCGFSCKRYQTILFYTAYQKSI